MLSLSPVAVPCLSPQRQDAWTQQQQHVSTPPYNPGASASVVDEGAPSGFSYAVLCGPVIVMMQMNRDWRALEIGIASTEDSTEFALHVVAFFGLQLLPNYIDVVPKYFDCLRSQTMKV